LVARVAGGEERFVVEVAHGALGKRAMAAESWRRSGKVVLIEIIIWSKGTDRAC
jgi:hypothetical protein